MKQVLLSTIAGLVLLTGVAIAQSGPINVVTVDPRENADLANTTGTETGQPSDIVPRSYNMANGLNPVTTNMSGYGSNDNLNRPLAGAKAAPATTQTTAKDETGRAKRNERPATKK